MRPSEAMYNLQDKSNLDFALSHQNWANSTLQKMITFPQKNIESKLEVLLGGDRMLNFYQFFQRGECMRFNKVYQYKKCQFLWDFATLLKALEKSCSNIMAIMQQVKSCIISDFWYESWEIPDTFVLEL